MGEDRITIQTFGRRKKAGEKITALTAYDALVAQLLDRAGVDLILVGDSLGNVVQGEETTIPVTLEEMIYHGEIVARTVSRAFVAVDMPFMTFQVSPEDALRNAGRIIQLTGCRAVKLEGGVRSAATISRLTEAGIPVIGHVGMTPQSVRVFGGFGLQGKDNEEKILADAHAVRDAGAFAVVLEKIPAVLATRITGELDIPTIGIGAGAGCDGQVLVTPDFLGMNPSFTPRYVRKYADLAGEITRAVSEYCTDVRNGSFPGLEESYD